MTITAKITGRSVSAVRDNAKYPAIAASVPRQHATIPGKAEWRNHFPFGVFMDASGATANLRDMSKNDGTGHTVDCTNPSGLRELIYHPESGLLANGLNYIMWTAGDSAGESVNGWSNIIEAVPQDMWQVVAPLVQVDNEWFQNEGISHTDGEADTIVNSILSVYANHPSVLAWNLWDDVATGTQGSRLATLVRSFIRNDPYQRPASAAIISNAVEDTLASNGGVVTFSYNYPCGDLASATPTAEGDLRREQNGSDVDWLDKIDLSTRNANLTYWMITQAHQTNDDFAGDPTDLRYPYPSEIPLMTWLAIGEGYKGIFWFAYSDQAPHWDGIGSVASRDRMKAIGRMAKRLTMPIRQRLLTTSKVADAFTTSGGGSVVYAGSFSYPNAYVSTLYDSDADVYYAVVCNRNTSSAEVTISSGSMFGDLVNLETGERLRLGQSVTLPGLDGGIWMLDPIVGVPHWSIDYSMNVETWWADHWANSASTNYVAPADITTHSNVITVNNGEDLNAVIAAGPSYTTYSLAAGATFGWVRVTDKEGIHIVSANPANKATVAGIEIFGSSELIQYNGNLTGCIVRLAAGDDDTRRAFLNPARDFIIRDITFSSDGTWSNYEYYDLDGTTQHDHYNSHLPIWLANCQDVLIEGCTFNGNTYLVSTDNGLPPTAFTLEVNDFDWNHVALINGNRGIHNVVIRNNTFTNAEFGAGQKKASVTYLDGAYGCIMVGNTFEAGNYNGGAHVFLSNDDFTLDTDRDGRFRLNWEQRHPRYNVITGNTYGWFSFFVNTQGFQNMWSDNAINLATQGVSCVYYLTTRTSARSTQGVTYYHYDHVVSNNTFTNGSINYFCAHVPDNAGLDSSVRGWGRCGRTTIKNNTAPSTPTQGWAPLDRTDDLLGPSVTSSDGPNTVTGNSP